MKTEQPRWIALIGTAVLVLALIPAGVATADSAPAGLEPSEGVKRIEFTSGESYLIVEVLDDDLVHFELSEVSPSPGSEEPILTTPQVADVDYPGPTAFEHDGNTVRTPGMRIDVDEESLCLTVHDSARTPELILHTLCPRNLEDDWKGLTITQEGMTHAYGLGQQFFEGGSADGDWVGRTRTPGDQFGNAMAYDPDNGPVGNTQIPVLFALGEGTEGYGILLDHVYKMEWDLTGDPWTVETWGDEIRWYVMTGPDLKDLRRDYMELTGHPPVPPRSTFGLWMSEFGFRNWGEIDEQLARLRSGGFPVDGFVLDLFWFGGVEAGSDNTSMGSLTWDTDAFPDPAERISSYADDGLGLMLIEESYVGRGLAEHSDLEERGYLVRDGCADCPPVYLTENDWWGRGGMIDWTDENAGDYWHDSRRQPLIEDGIVGHWLDLGEPEMYSSDDWVHGIFPGNHAHADYHNIYNLSWAESVARGYERAESSQRPFILTRSGAAGIQRHGTAMWSADIGSRLPALAAQQNAHMHMSMSGVDYYGSDIGGFRREMLDTDLDELYTQWFANGAWFEVPIRPHTENLCDCHETSPAAIGDIDSNLANLRQRYELTPYYYSLAHRAHRDGEPVIPPMVYHYQDDPEVREMGHQKLIGEDILVGVVAGEGERQRNMYLPEGRWINYHTNESILSEGEWIEDVPVYINGTFRLPTFAKAGAILPMMHVDENTANTHGDRLSGDARDELIVRTFADPAESSFTLFEDDGNTTSYEEGAVRVTELSQQLVGSTATVTVNAAQGTYVGAESSRDTVVELIVEDTQASTVTLNGQPLNRYANQEAFEAADTGWYNAGGNLIVAKTGHHDVTADKVFEFLLEEPPVSIEFVCENGQTDFGQSVYAVGGVPQLGDWSPGSAVLLDPTDYPTWSGTVGNLPPNTEIEWKCIIRQESGVPNMADVWQPGENNAVTTPASGHGGVSVGKF